MASAGQIGKRAAHAPLSLVIALMALIAALNAGCSTMPKSSALAASAKYSKAIESGDVDTILAMSDPALTDRAPPDELRRVLTEIFVAQPEVTSIRDEPRSISDPFWDWRGIHYFVEGTRISMRRDGTRVEVDNFYLLTSRDLGRTWKVLDNMCADERWVKEVAPGWTGSPPLPGQSVRVTQVESIMRRTESVAPALEKSSP